MATEKDYRVCRGCKQGSIGWEAQSGFPEERLVRLDQVKRWQLHRHGPHCTVTSPQGHGDEFKM